MKISIFVCSLFMWITLLANTSLGQGGDFTCTTNRGAITIVGYTGEGGDIVIPPAINGMPVAAIGDRAFAWNRALTRVGMPSTLVSIGDYAFFSCSGLTGELRLSDSVRSIGDSAFGHCSRLIGELRIPASVIDIAGSAFRNCNELTGFSVDSGNPSYASVDDVLFNKEITVLIKCPRGKMGRYTIPSSVVRIKSGAFDGCRGLTGVLRIPSSVVAIEGEVFPDRCGLTGIVVDSGNPSYASIDGVLFNEDLTTLIKCPSKKDGEFAIPASVTKIEKRAFSGCGELTGRFMLPVGITDIGESAFFGCHNLTGELVIPPGIRCIEDYTFKHCRGLTGELKIPAGVTKTGREAFEGCSGLSGEILITAKLTSLGGLSFGDCRGITGITVDDDNPVYASEDGVLFNKDKTTLIYYPAGKRGDYILPAGVRVKSAAFRDCCQLTSITVPADNSFHSSVDGVLFDKNQTRLLRCPSAKEGNYIIPPSVTSIWCNAFRNCNRLTAVTVPASVTSIRSEAFRVCSNLVSITVDEDNTSYHSVGGVLFGKGRARLMQCPAGKQGRDEIPDGTTYVCSFAFDECRGLTDISIPSSVTYIGAGVFYFCNDKLRLRFHGNAPCVSSAIFLGNDSVAVCRTPKATGWPSVPDTFYGRPTALWQQTAFRELDYLVNLDSDGVSSLRLYALDTELSVTDSDSDGLSDRDEVTLYGSNPTSFDSDGDGESDYLEIAMGFCPTNALSKLNFRAFATGAEYQLRFMTTTGGIFYLESRDSLVEGDWVERTGGGGTGTERKFVDPLGSSNRFYRVRVVR